MTGVQTCALPISNIRKAKDQPPGLQLDRRNDIDDAKPNLLVRRSFGEPFNQERRLLLELLISAHVPELDQDYENSPSLMEPSADGVDGMSSIAAGSTNAVNAEVVNPYGLVAQVTSAPFPTLSVTPADTNLVLSWPSHPEPIRLQHKDSLDPSVVWKDYTEPGILRGDLTSLLEIPRASLQARRYFRLYWNSPQVGLPDSTVEVGPEPTTNPVIP